MKKLTLLLFVAMLLTACSPAPQDVVNSWQSALNKGDVDAALSYLAEDATVTIIPPAEGDGIYNGHDEIRGWYETIASGKGTGSLQDCRSDGDTFTCISTYADEGLKVLGVDFIEGNWVAVIQAGKIQSYTFTITPKSLAKFPPPPTVPVETLANSASDFIGIWWYPKAGVKVEYKADGTFRVYGSEAIGELDTGSYTFEAGKLTSISKTSSCVDNPATYEVYVTRQDGNPVSIRLQVLGEDTCQSRANVLAEEGKFQSP